MKRLIGFLLILLCCACLGCGNDKAPRPPAGYPNIKLLKWAILLKWEKLVDTKPSLPDSIECMADLIYKKIGSRELKLDVYRHKKSTAAAATLIFIHGGAWKSGDKRDYLAYLLPFAAKGYVTVSVAYRFSKEAVFPAAVEDVKCALRWLKKHGAEYGMDVNRFALIGGSAGGHLAMMAGYTADVRAFTEECEIDSLDDRVQAIVDIYGPSDLTTAFAQQNGVVIKFIGQTYADAPEHYRRASPLAWLDSGDPPTLIFHGTLDDVVPISQSDSLAARLQRLGVAMEYHRLKGWPHTMDLSKKVNAYCFYYMDRFFQTHLSGHPHER